MHFISLILDNVCRVLHIFKQEFKIPIIITASINAIITYFLLMKNMDGIIKLNLIVVPIMVVIIIAISIKNYPIINLINNLNTNTQKTWKINT